MNPLRTELRTVRARIIFDTEDAYARSERVFGAHPRPLGSLAYRLVARRSNGVDEPFADPIVLGIVRNPSGYDLCFGPRRLDLPPGVYVLRVEGALYQPAEIPITFPVAGIVIVDLHPGPAYPFPNAGPPGKPRLTLLRGTVVNDADGSPVPRATVTVAGWPGSCLTDDSGQWVLPGPGVLSADVTARLPDGTSKTRNGVPVTAARDSVTVPQFRF